MFILQYENSVPQEQSQWALELEPSRTSAGKEPHAAREPQVRHPCTRPS